MLRPGFLSICSPTRHLPTSRRTYRSQPVLWMTAGFAFNPGGPSTINMLRAYYLRGIAVDLFRPYLANIKADGDSDTNHYLIVATTAYRNEAYE